jgi:putative SOS response-associated peptidase YedK
MDYIGLSSALWNFYPIFTPPPKKERVHRLEQGNMIDHYSITASPELVTERFSVDVPEFYHAHYNASPAQLLPVITSSTPEGLSLFYWGTSPEFARNKTLGEKLVNQRTEYFDEKPILKKALRSHRCIIPADGFYGWKKLGKKTSVPYRFVFKSQQIFSFPGLWEEFEDTEGQQIQTFTIVTTPSDAFVGAVQERMPVILNPESEKIWMDKNSTEEKLLRIFRSSVTTGMNYYPVSPKITQKDMDTPSLIIPTPPADQHGNLTLFD